MFPFRQVNRLAKINLARQKLMLYVFYQMCVEDVLCLQFFSLSIFVRIGSHCFMSHVLGLWSPHVWGFVFGGLRT